MDLDSFSDDGLDNLSDSALQEIDRIAIQFTQAQAQTQAQHLQPSQASQQHKQQQDDQQYANYGWEEDDDLDTTEVTNVSGLPVARPPLNKPFPQQQQQQQQQHQRQPLQRPAPPAPNPQWNPAITPVGRPGASGLSSRPRLPSTGPSNTAAGFGSQRFPSDLPPVNRPQASQFARPIVPANRFTSSQASQAPPGDIVSALQRRVRALEADLAAARGEASIIRANHNKTQKEHHDEVARLKKLNAEQLAKQERIAEAAVAAEVNANTELEFLQRDMREVNNRARRKDAASGAPAPSAVTPKKAAKSWGIADGFDDMDIVFSPTKGQGRAKNAGSVALNVGERTPSKGKRKRPPIESPVMALDTHTGDVVMDESEKPVVAWESLEILGAAPAPWPFDYLPLVLDHGAFYEHPPTFEVLSRFFFPSDPDVSLASVILQKLPVMGRPGRPLQLLVDFVELVTAMWDRCHVEEFLDPIKYLTSLISFTFDLHTTAVASITIASLAPVAQATIFSVGEARHRVSDGDLSKHSEYSMLDEHIDSTHILSLLHTSALACAATPADNDDTSRYGAADFWKLITLDTVFLLLTPKQKLADIIGMLHLIALSPQPTSIGPITDDKEPELVARHVIDRVSAKLTDFPRSANSPELKRKVQLAALRALISFAQYPFGAMQLAVHNNALPRLVTCLSASIDALYNQPLPQNILPPLPDHHAAVSSRHDSEASPSTELCQIISQCVLVIYKLVTDPHTANFVDISQKLSMSHGGSQRYLLALVRLTFAEDDVFMESGIDNDFVEAAHELLEMAVTPDEGEIISAAFGTG